MSHGNDEELITRDYSLLQAQAAESTLSASILPVCPSVGFGPFWMMSLSRIIMYKCLSHILSFPLTNIADHQTYDAFSHSTLQKWNLPPQMTFHWRAVCLFVIPSNTLRIKTFHPGPSLRLIYA